MKLKHIISLSAITLPITVGCVDLNFSEVQTNDKEWVYSMPSYVSGLVSNVYAHVRYDLGQYNGAMKASATDESDYAISISDIHKFYNGGWSPINPFDQIWTNNYSGIAQANNFLEELDKIYLSLEEYRYNVTVSPYEDLKKQFELYEFQVRFLRAYFYFELVRTYGDVPLVTKVLTNAEANVMTRTPAKEVFKFIIDECDAIADKLPITYEDEPNQDINRINRITVLALKARTLLYQASPLFNSSGDKTLWFAAAKANKDVIDFAPVTGVQMGKYAELSGESSYANKEMIWIRGTGTPQDWKMNSVEKFNFPIGVENGQSGNCPTQSLVDAYEYKAGNNKGKTFGEVWTGNTINLSTSNPYADLDPRFAMTVVKNGDVWPAYTGKAIETFEGGANASPIYGATQTGYYLRKLCDPNANISTNNPSPKRHNFVLYRLSEFYLNYAEAIYHVTGRADDEGDFGLTANKAISTVRARSDVKMPNFQGNDPSFMNKYMRERMIELAFEDHRFWDVRRWKKGNEFFATVKTANLTKSSDGIILTRGQRARGWEDKYYFFPIPFTEIQKNNKLVQNPGW
ncbi:MAG: SusD family protein [Bacteroidetes bacterium ADurb.BinA174]|nr:MAG: SusD family protein [Bacteroidetes bacterium ADurb.BinA174]